MAGSMSLCFLLAALSGQEGDPVERAYEVQDLLQPLEQPEHRGWPSAGEFLISAWTGLNVAPSTFTPEEGGGGPPALEPGAGCGADALDALVRAHVAPGTWGEGGNSVVVGPQLLVTAPAAVQEGVAGLLATLRARRARTVQVDIACVPLEALGQAAGKVGAPLASDEFEAALGRAGERGLWISMATPNEVRRRAFSGRSRTFLSDFEVNPTGVVPVANPVVGVLPLGITVEALPEAIAESGLWKLEVRATVLSEAGPMARRETFYGTIEMPRVAEDTLETVLSLPAGAAVVAGFVTAGRGPERRDFALVARLRPAAAPGPPAPGTAGAGLSVRVHDLAFLLEPLPGEGSIDPAFLFKEIEAAVDPLVWQDGQSRLEWSEDGRRLLATAPAATQAGLQAYIDGLIAARAGAAVLEVRVLEGPIEEVLAVRREAEGGLFLPQGWMPGGSLRDAARAAVAAIPGARLRARSLSTRAYVGDVKVVSGGTGVFTVNLHDPEIHTGGDGLTLDAIVGGTDVRGAMQADLALDECRTQLTAADMLLPAPGGSVEAAPARRVGAGGTAGTTPQPKAAMVRVPFTLDLPRQERHHAAGRFLVPPGRALVVQAEETAGGVGRLVVLSASCTQAHPSRREAGRHAHVLDLGFLAGSRLAVSPPRVSGAIEDLDPAALGEDRAADAAHEEPGTEPGAADEASALIGRLSAGTAVEEGSLETTLESERLLLRGPAAILDRAAAVVDALVSRAAPRAVDLALVHPAALAKAAPEALKPGASPWLDQGALERAVAADPAGAALFAAAAQDGVRMPLRSAAAACLLGDYEVNQTGVMPVVNPVVDAVFEGLHAEATVRRTPQDGWVRVDLELGRNALRGKPERRRVLAGALDLASTDRTHVRSVLLAPEERTVLVGFVDAPGAGPASYAALLRVRRPAFAAPAAQDTAPPQAIEAAALLEALPDGRARIDLEIRHAADEGGAKEPRGVPLRPVESRALEEAVAAALGEQAAVAGRIAAGAVFLPAEEPRAAEARLALEGLARERLRPVVVDVWLGEAVAEELGGGQGAGAILDAAWLERMATRPGLRTRLVGLRGAGLSLAALSTRRYVADLNLVAGGTQSEVQVAADPEVQDLWWGLLLNARVEPALGAGEARLELRCDLAGPPRFEGRAASVRASSEVPVSDAGIWAPADPAGERVAIDLPELPLARWKQATSVPLGRPVLVGVASDPAAPGKARACVVVASELAWP